jgi:chromosome segregation ATPase
MGNHSDMIAIQSKELAKLNNKLSKVCEQVSRLLFHYLEVVNGVIGLQSRMKDAEKQVAVMEQTIQAEQEPLSKRYCKALMKDIVAISDDLTRQAERMGGRPDYWREVEKHTVEISFELHKSREKLDELEEIISKIIKNLEGDILDWIEELHLA